MVLSLCRNPAVAFTQQGDSMAFKATEAQAAPMGASNRKEFLLLW